MRDTYNGEYFTSFNEALRMVRETVAPVGTEERPVGKCAGFVSAGTAISRITSPSVRTSLKDGFAVRTADIPGSKLRIAGSIAAGGIYQGEILAGQAVKVFTGAPVPEEADAVVACEMCDEGDGYVLVSGDVKVGQDIAPAGNSIKEGGVVVESGMLITPLIIARAVTGGIETLKVYRKPRFGLIGIGDELAEPGKPLKAGQLYASNLAYNTAWMEWLGLTYESALLPDDEAVMKDTLTEMVRHADAIVTSGGVMGSERDVTVGALDSLGWSMKFRHVRMSPGKATAFGILLGKPVFCFSGGPDSNVLAFLEFALPSIYGMIKLPGPPLRTVTAILGKDIMVKDPGRTEFRDGRLDVDENGTCSVMPLDGQNRMQSLGAANCLVYKPEGIGGLKKGNHVTVQILPGTSYG